jgi:phosphonate transport system substrate-binding protein
MKKNVWLVALVLFTIVAVLLTGCAATEAPAPTEAPPPPTEPPPSEAALGSEERPIQVYFVPSAEIDEIVAGGEVMRQALEETTGLKFEVFVPTSYAAAIEGMCAAPADTMGFPATLAYVVANARCGVDASMMSIRFGWDKYWTQFLVARDSDIQSLEDLNGKTWGFTDATSTSGYMFPLMQLESEGIELGGKVATGGHAQAVLAVYNGEVDVSTSYYTPPSDVPEGEPAWKEGDPPEPWSDILDQCGVSEDGSAMWCGGYRIRDARSASGVRSVAPDAMQATRIIALSDAIPNDNLAFGPDFPPDIRKQIEEALLAFKETEGWDQSIGDFYTWEDVRPTTDSEYDLVRDYIEGAGYSMDDIVGMLEQ